MNRKTNRRWLATGLLAVMLTTTGCERHTLYHHYEHTPLTAWEKSDTLFFAVRKMTDRALIRRDVELRISDRYPYQQLCLVVEQTTLPSRFIRRDTLNCRLTSPEGEMLGKGVTLYQKSFHLPDVILNEGDSLAIKVHHAMKRQSLPGIADVGILLKAY